MQSVGRWASAGLVILLGLLGARDVYAWGDAGHEIICEIAFPKLNPQARARVIQLLQRNPDFSRFSKACTWPDHPGSAPMSTSSTCRAPAHRSGRTRVPWTTPVW
jgi:hypothetical protein